MAMDRALRVALQKAPPGLRSPWDGLADDHKLEAKGILTKAISVVGPEPIPSRAGIVLQQEGIACGHKALPEPLVLELVLQHRHHGIPIASMSAELRVFMAR